MKILAIVDNDTKYIERRIKRLEWYARLLFFLTAIIGAGVLYEIVISNKHAKEWGEKYNNSIALADSANRLVIANALRWKARQDSLDAERNKQ